MGPNEAGSASNLKPATGTNWSLVKNPECDAARPSPETDGGHSSWPLFAGISTYVNRRIEYVNSRIDIDIACRMLLPLMARAAVQLHLGSNLDNGNLMYLERQARVHVELSAGRKLAYITAAVASLSAIGGAAVNFAPTTGSYFWIAVGSALGGVSRYWASGVAARLMGETFPWGTLVINVLGSFIIGFFATLTGPDGRVYASAIARQFVMIGVCGGFTTFSSFSLHKASVPNW